MRHRSARGRIQQKKKALPNDAQCEKWKLHVCFLYAPGKLLKCSLAGRESPVIELKKMEDEKGGLRLK